MPFSPLRGTRINEIQQTECYGCLDVGITAKARPLKTSNQHDRNSRLKINSPNLKQLLIIRPSSVLDVWIIIMIFRELSM